MKWPRSDPSKFHAICLLSQAYTVLSISVLKRVKMTQNKHIAYNQNGVVSGGARKKVPGQPHYVKTGRIQHCGCDGKCRMHARWLRSAFDRLSQDYMSLVAHSLPETPINVIGSLYGQVKVVVEFCKATVWFFSYLSAAKFCVCSLHRPWRRHHIHLCHADDIGQLSTDARAVWPTQEACGTGHQWCQDKEYDV